MSSVPGAGDTNIPSLWDLTEIPSITICNSNVPQPSENPYVDMLKEPEFTWSSKDFPPLPGTHNRKGVSTGGSASSGDGAKATTTESDKNTSGIQTYPDGRVTNIPGSMIKDQFGMAGLLSSLRAAETDSNIASAILGEDLTAVGLDVNSAEYLFPTFDGPYAKNPCPPQYTDVCVPPEYIFNNAIRHRLAPINLSGYRDDLLFYLFYNNIGDILQIKVAHELYNRGWKYHTEEKVFTLRVPGSVLKEKTWTYERGTYYFFDAKKWKQEIKEFHMDYSKLVFRPNLK